MSHNIRCIRKDEDNERSREIIKCPHVNMNPTTWQQVEQTNKMLREVAVTAPTAKVQVRGV